MHLVDIYPWFQSKWGGKAAMGNRRTNCSSHSEVLRLTLWVTQMGDERGIKIQEASNGLKPARRMLKGTKVNI